MRLYSDGIPTTHLTSGCFAVLELFEVLDPIPLRGIDLAEEKP